jgi:uncharacterized protein YbjT (DUF2867 family)
LAGVTAVFHVGPAFAPDGVAMGINMVEGARRAGVRKFVYSSVIHPTLGALSNHRDVGPVEQAVLESGILYAILHPTMFFQNIAASWRRVLQSGTFAKPWSTETRFSRVDYRDVAEVAAIALTEDRLDYGTYELAAPGWLNRHDVARLMGEVLGRPVTADQVDPKQFPEWAGPIRDMFVWYDTHGLLGNPLTLRAVLGREPRTLRAYFEELKAKEVKQ